eukprot:9184541-Alexandrium_andersonii.AAC.1
MARFLESSSWIHPLLETLSCWSLVKSLMASAFSRLALVRSQRARAVLPAGRGLLLLGPPEG